MREAKISGVSKAGSYFYHTFTNPNILKRRTIRFTVVIFRTILIVGLCYLFLFPLFYLALAAFSTANSVDDPSVVWIPKAFTLENFQRAFEGLNFAKSSFLSARITIFSTLASLCSCSLVGYGFARFNFFEKKAAFVLVILMIIIPPQTTLMYTKLNFRDFDFGGLLKLLEPITGVSGISLISTPWVFILPSMFASGLRSGLFIFIFRQFFLGLPKDLEEAARIDGCGALKTFIRVIVPISVPAFITVILFSVVWHWNDLYISSMLFDSDVRPITAMLHTLNSSLKVTIDGRDVHQTASMGRAILASGAMLAILPPLGIYVFTQRFFVESIERTGIVG